MGFRTTATTNETHGLDIPEEFFDKYPYVAKTPCDRCEGKYHFPMSLTREIKFYNEFERTEMFLDIQKLMIAQDYNSDIVFVLLHECEGITKVHIYKDKILGMEPTAWKSVTSVTHNYCYGCSDPKNI